MQLERQVHWMREALRQASLAAARQEVPVGAVVVHGDASVAAAGNCSLADTDMTAHAEIVALRQAAQVLGNHRLPECDLFVTLEPCCMCAGAIIQARLRHVYYAAHDAKAGALGGAGDINTWQLNHVIRSTGGLLAHESKALLQAFFKARRS